MRIDGIVPFIQNAVTFKSDRTAEEIMIMFANQENDDDAKSDITQFKETAIEVGIHRIVEGTIMTYQTLVLNDDEYHFVNPTYKVFFGTVRTNSR